MTSVLSGGCARILLIAAALAGCLAADVHTNIVGQTVVGLAVWLMLFSLLDDVDRDERFALMACLVIATAGEMFLLPRLGPVYVSPRQYPVVRTARARAIAAARAFARTPNAGSGRARHYRWCRRLLARGRRSRSRHVRRSVVHGACGRIARDAKPPAFICEHVCAGART